MGSLKDFKSFMNRRWTDEGKPAKLQKWEIIYENDDINCEARGGIDNGTPSNLQQLPN